MPIIIGLGNIGDEYARTRHNVGFDVILKLADTLSVKLSPGKGPFLAGIGKHKGIRTVLILPTTYMNKSGLAVSKALNYYKEPLSDCLICTDDINLPVGKIRLRPNGGAGGHNGLNDIIENVKSKEFPRLRFGIDKNFPRGKQADYVLSPFDNDEQNLVNESLIKAHDAVLCFIREGIERAMNKYN